MGTDDKTSVIHRKAMGARTELDARLMSPAKALRLALAKTADKMFGLAVTVTTVEQVRIGHGKIQKEAGEDALLLLLDGASGVRGAARVDQQFLMALIEVQTTGQVRRSEAATRRVTRTDAAIVAPLLDVVLRRYDEQLKAADAHYVEQGYRFGDLIEDARTLSLALEAPDYDLFRLTLDIEDGAKTGLLTLMLPHREEVVAKPGAADAGAGPAISLEKSAMEGQVVMDAVLTRLRLPLNEICALKPGMQLPLEAGCLGKTQMIATGGHVVARVRMGQMNGMRAVRFVAGAAQEDGRATAEAVGADRKALARLGKADLSSDMADDVLEGTADPVLDDLPEDVLAGLDLPDDLDLPDLPDETGAETGGEVDAAKEELSAADLMLAANAASAQSQTEEA